MPYSTKEELEQWKNFICSFFGKFTLEKYEKNRIEVLTKEKNSFLNDVEAVESLESLRDLIKNRLTEEQKNFFSAELQDKKEDVRKIRRNKSLKIAVVVGVIALYGGTVFLMKVNEKNQVTATQQSADTEITILNKIIDNDSSFHEILSLHSQTFFKTPTTEAPDDKIANQGNRDQDQNNDVCHLTISIFNVEHSLTGQNLSFGGDQ